MVDSLVSIAHLTAEAAAADAAHVLDLATGLRATAGAVPTPREAARVEAVRRATGATGRQECATPVDDAVETALRLAARVP